MKIRYGRYYSFAASLRETMPDQSPIDLDAHALRIARVVCNFRRVARQANQKARSSA